MELTPQEEVALGRAAADLLKPESVFTRALVALGDRYQEDMQSTPDGIAGTAAREALHAKSRALADIKRELKILQDNGDLAARQIAEEEKRAKQQ